jgi:uncharacterized protein YggE
MPKEEKLKNWFWRLINALLVVAVLLGLSSMAALYKYQKSLYPARTVTVSAEGKTTVTPDIATLSFSVVSEGRDPGRLSGDNTKKMNAAIDFMKMQGVEAKDIKTAGYNLSPRYEYDEDRRTTFISGYTLSQTVMVKVRDFSKIGAMLGALPGLGINQIGSLSFDIEDQDVFLNAAREEAFAKARAKAKAMAKQNGARIKRVVTFSESQGGYYPRPVFEAYGKGAADLAAVPAPSIEPGSQEVTVNVTVVYEIR